ncbi:MAG: aminotransferase class I/II-fold pyridoxal phosphate-dependent enzyme [Bacteroidota bacterium]
MTLEKESLNALTDALTKLEKGFDHLPAINSNHDVKNMKQVLDQVAEKMQNNYPYFHPLFAGQMLKPPHPVAKAAYMLSLWINPNNHALDGSKASSPMEKEVVADLAGMFGWKEHLGHLTGGGTLANLEALWVADKTHPGKTILASNMSHYTHERICGVLKIDFEKVETDAIGRMDVSFLETLLKTRDVGTVVCTIGATGTGSVDPLEEVLELQKKYGFRIHADAAYGGYFGLTDNLALKTAKNYEVLKQVDSIVIDPHKHGLQPYGCGCILFQNPEVAKYYLHDSPYTYFTSDDLHLGEISLECSRAGASAVALWATHQLLPPVKHGDFSKDLSKSRDAALDLHARLQSHSGFYPIMEPETDIVIWAVKGERTDQMNDLAQAFFEIAESNQLYLSLYNYPTSKLPKAAFEVNTEHLTCLRSCLMKPEHSEWMQEIWNKITWSFERIKEG